MRELAQTAAGARRHELDGAHTRGMLKEIMTEVAIIAIGVADEFVVRCDAQFCGVTGVLETVGIKMEALLDDRCVIMHSCRGSQWACRGQSVPQPMPRICWNRDSML